MLNILKGKKMLSIKVTIILYFSKMNVYTIYRLNISDREQNFSIVLRTEYGGKMKQKVPLSYIFPISNR